MTNARNGKTILLLALTLFGSASGLLAADPGGKTPGVAGRVLGETSSPLGAAGVYAYQLADLSFRKVLTDGQGNFLFQELPAGLYKIIAHKPGFTPVVVMLTRTAASTYQFLEVQLAPQPKGSKAKTGEDFWSIRARIPSDVLREIDESEAQLARLEAAASGEMVNLADLSRFTTDFQAMTGVDQIAESGEGQVSSGGLGVSGKVGEMQVGLRGRFQQFSPNAFEPGSTAGSGEASTLSLDVQGDASRISVM
jgi:hypothetical protein